MFQTWSELLFLHWEVPAEDLQKLLPPGLTVDTFEGKAYVGLIPFTMSRVRPVWFPPVPILSDFHECNVRTYVHRRGENPGVWFFSLDAANPIAVGIARTLWKLPYFYAKMELSKGAKELESGNENGNDSSPTSETRYLTRRIGRDSEAAFCETKYAVRGEPASAKPDTLEFFLVERYLLYAFSNRLLIGQVNHRPYPLQSASLDFLSENLVSRAGIARPDTPPLIHYASCVDVEIFPLRPVTA